MTKTTTDPGFDTSPFRLEASDITSQITRKLRRKEDHFIYILRRIENAMIRAYNAGRENAYGKI